MILVDQPISAYYPIVGNLGQGKVVRGQFTRGKDLVKSKQECLIMNNNILFAIWIIQSIYFL